jgi:hypothetical protein
VYVAADTTSADNGGTIVVQSNGARRYLVVNTPTVSSKALGVKGDGVTGETDALLAADAMARGRGKTLYVEGIVVLDKQLYVNYPTSWLFAGANGSGGSNLQWPASYLKVPATQPTGQVALIITTDGVQFHGGGVLSFDDFQYDALQVAGYGFRWTGGPCFGGVGRDCVRVGADSGFDVNANGLYMENPVAAYCGRHGFNFDDVGGDIGGVNDNTFHIVKPFVHHNVAHGMRFGRTYLGGTITAPLIERNGIGVYFEPEATGIILVAGNIEDNTGPEGIGTLQNEVFASATAKFSNMLLGTTVQGVIGVRPLAFSGTYAPQPYGADFAGGRTYVHQKGSYVLSNGFLHVQIHLSWTGHGGTGQLYCTLPDMYPGVPINTTFIDSPLYTAATVITAGLSLSAGQSIVALVPNNTPAPRLQFYVQQAGALSAYAVPTSGEIFVNVTVPILKF